MKTTNLYTFGEFLKQLLEKKSITVTELAELTETRSRTTIQRLLKDQSGIRVIESFRNKLQRLPSDWLTTEELNLLNQSVEVSRYGKSRIKARHILFNLSNSPKPTFRDNRLSKLFPTASDYESIRILIFDLLNTELTAELISFVRDSDDCDIIIYHVITLNHSEVVNAETSSIIFQLLNYKYYYPYYQNDSLPCGNTYSDMSNILIMRKVTKDGKAFTDFIRLDRNGRLTALSDNPGDALYYYFTDSFFSRQSRYIPIRMSYTRNSIANRLADLSEYLQSLERSSSEYLIKQNMCIQMIPTDILYNMLVDSDFLGLSETDPGIQRLINIITDRCDHYFDTNKEKIHFSTKRGLKDFVSSRQLSDHFYLFREFTADELKKTLTFVIDQIRINPHYKMYLLKEDFRVGNIEYVYYEDRAIYLFDSCSGYDEDMDDGIITAKPYLEIFDDFIKNELIPHHTYSEADTLDFLEQLLSSL
jgi:transcriptional regulator with XRE-family HTH domain